jgi:hypothetical protein
MWVESRRKWWSALKRLGMIWQRVAGVALTAVSRRPVLEYYRVWSTYVGSSWAAVGKEVCEVEKPRRLEDHAR